MCSSDLETIGTELLRNIRSIFNRARADGGQVAPLEVLSVSELCVRLVARVEWQWVSFEHGRPLTTYHLKKLLRPYDIKPEQRRVGGRDRRRGFWRDQFEPAWSRYVADSPSADDESRETSESTPEGASEPAENTNVSPPVGVSLNSETGAVPEDVTKRDGHPPRWTDVDQSVFEHRMAEITVATP